MKTILLLGPKGGVGKSTIARNLAACAAQAGLSTATLDTDPQATFTKWWEARPSTVPALDHYQVPLAELREAPDRIDGAHLLVVDTPTAIEAYPLGIGALLDAADLVLMPLNPTPEDVLSVVEVAPMVREHGKQPVFILNRCMRRVKDVEDARAVLVDLGMMAPVDLPYRAEVYRSFTLGLGAVEQPRCRTAEQFRQLWQFSAERLGLGGAA